MPYEDLSPLVAFLASEAAGYINGQVIGIDAQSGCKSCATSKT